MLYDQIINNNRKCVVTYVDYSAAFDSISHKFMDTTLTKAGASRKSRAMLRAIYSVTQGRVRVRGINGPTSYQTHSTLTEGWFRAILSRLYCSNYAAIRHQGQRDEVRTHSAH